MAISPDNSARADDFINESERDASPANDGGRGVKLESSAHISRKFFSVYFGYGDEGDVIFDGANTFSFANLSGDTYTLTEDIIASYVKIDSGITLKTNGYVVYAYTIENQGSIDVNGNPATSDPGLTEPDERIGGEAAHTGGTLADPPPGEGGKQDGTVQDGDDENPALGVNGASGGDGEGSGGAAGTATLEDAQITLHENNTTTLTANTTTSAEMYIVRVLGVSSNTALSPSAGSGAGGALSSATAGIHQSGGSGSPGGIMVLAASKIVNTGTIQANGGDGGDAYTDTSETLGGGGGGSGGVIVLLYEELTNTGTVEATGGTGGQPTGSGTAGSNGNSGNIYKAKITQVYQVS